jgi:hypothetical protein
LPRTSYRLRRLGRRREGRADRESGWRALLDVDLLAVGREAPLVGVLGALRMNGRGEEIALGAPASSGGP